MKVQMESENKQKKESRKNNRGREFMKKSLREQLNDKRRKNVEISLFESAENLNVQLENMKRKMDKYLNEKIPPEIFKKKKKPKEIVKMKHTIMQDMINEDDERRKRIKEMALNGELEKMFAKKTEARNREENIKRIERERIERFERIEIERVERIERERVERVERIERERIDRNERDRIDRIERDRIERDRVERERLFQEELRIEKIKQEKIIRREIQMENEMKSQMKSADEKEKEESLKKQRGAMDKEKQILEQLRMDVEIESFRFEQNKKNNQVEVKQTKKEGEVQETSELRLKIQNWKKKVPDTKDENSVKVFQELEKFLRGERKSFDDFPIVELPSSENIEAIPEETEKKLHGAKGLDKVEYENKQIFRRVDKNLSYKKRKEEYRLKELKQRRFENKSKFKARKMNYNYFDYDKQLKKQQEFKEKQKLNQVHMQEKFGQHFKDKTKPSDEKLVILKEGVHRHHTNCKHHCDLNKKYFNRKLELKSKTLSAWSKSPLTANSKGGTVEQDLNNARTQRSRLNKDDISVSEGETIVGASVDKEQDKAAKKPSLKEGNNPLTEDLPKKEVIKPLDEKPSDEGFIHTIGPHDYQPPIKKDISSKRKHSQRRKKINNDKSKERVKKYQRPKSQLGRNSSRNKKAVKPNTSRPRERERSFTGLSAQRSNRSRSNRSGRIKSLKKPKIGGIYGIKPQNLPSYKKETDDVSRKSSQKKKGFDPKNLRTNLQSNSIIYNITPKELIVILNIYK